MTESGEGKPGAERLYQEFLRRRVESSVDIEEFCRQHPDVSDALRALHSLDEGGSPTAAETHSTPSDVPSGSGARVSPGLSSLAATLELRPGDRVGGYELLKELGRGGFGIVFLAQQTEPVRRRVALKALKLGMDVKEVVTRFEAERQALARMNHPSIAGVYDAGVTSRGRPYFVMEHVDGETLTEFCDGRRLTTRRRLELFARVCKAMAHAHQKLILHRDLKPSNILVTTLDDGPPQPKIIDFGLAKALSQPLTEDTLATRAEQFVGTPAYMSPEQAGVERLDLDTRTDVYSLGVVLYELLTDSLPLDLSGGDIHEALRRVRELEPLSPSSRIRQLGGKAQESARKRATDSGVLQKHLRGDLDRITLKALQKDRNQRYQSTAELADDIERYLRGEPVLAQRPTVVYRTTKFCGRHRIGVSVGLLLFVAAVSACVWGWSRMSSNRRYVELVRLAQTALEDGDLESADTRLDDVRNEFPGRQQTQDLTERLNSARQTLGARDRANNSWREYQSADRQAERARDRWLAERDNLETWKPVWERRTELAAMAERVHAEALAERTFQEVLFHTGRALELSATDSDRLAASGILSKAFAMRRGHSDRFGEVQLSPVFYRNLQETYKQLHRSPTQEQRIQLESEPPGAQVFCFRFEEHWARMLPIPHHPAGENSSGGLHVLDAKVPGFRTNDRVLRIGEGGTIRSVEDVALAVREIGVGQAVDVEIERDGLALKRSWIPFKAVKPKVFDPCRDLSLTFPAYDVPVPSQLGASHHLGSTPLSRSFQEGSYLFVVRKRGFATTRVPVTLRGNDRHLSVPLVDESKIPPGFIYVPPGIVATGDEKAFQPLPWDESFVPGFFVARLEVTFRDWLEFLNDAEFFANRKFEEGRSTVLAPEAQRELSNSGESTVRLVPGAASTLLMELEGSPPRWRATSGVKSLDWPAIGISHIAALEYAYWRTLRENGPWRYRLPTDLEWERAARGTDRRSFVWGNYMVWNFSYSRLGGREAQRYPCVVGTTPTDESVFGVLDMNGSVCELTSDTIDPNERYLAYRGGSYYTSTRDENTYFRLASRNGHLPEGPRVFIGLRLVADLKDE